MHNLKTVVTFEIVRALKKKSFWVIALMVPMLIAAVFGVVIASNIATDSAVEELANERFSFAITDDSSLVNPEAVAAIGGERVDDKQAAIDRVERGELDAYIYYPRDLTNQRAEIYAQDVGIFQNGRYSSLAQQLLEQSVAAQVSGSQAVVLRGGATLVSTFYREGAQYDPLEEMIAPGLALVLFYFLISFFGNQMLTSTTEEKENRVIEMLLTTVQAKTLIVGKILSLVALGIIQGLIVIIPIIIGYFVARQYIDVPELNLQELPLDWERIAVAVVVFAVSFLLFTGLLVTIGAAVPTAKEAGSFFGVIMILIFGPLYAAPLFVSSPDSVIVQGLTYFPLTAPIPLLIRNTVDNLTYPEIVIALGLMTIAAAILLNIAIRVFRYGALEYSRKLGLKEILLGE